MKFFTEENHKVRVDLEIKTIKEFRLLIAKDKHRDKVNAVKWFAYIFFMNDYRSPFFQFAKSERHDKVCTSLELENFKPFKELLDAQQVYLQFMETPAVRSLKSINDGLVTSSRLIDLLNDRVNESLEAVSSGEDIDLEEIETMADHVNRLLTLSDKLPKAINNITALEEKVKKEQAQDSKIRGGGTKGAFED